MEIHHLRVSQEIQSKSKKALLDMANEKEIKPTDQRIAAEVDAVLYKVITDLHTYSENPMDPEEVLKLCKEKSKEQVPTQATAQSDVTPGGTATT